MNTRRSLIFLERQSYRRRRLIDWIRVLPIIGLILWLVPLLWPVDGTGQVSTADAVVYLFAVWFVLVFIKGLSSWALARASRDDGSDGATPSQSALRPQSEDTR